MHNHGGTDASLVLVLLVEPERGITGMRPAGIVGPVGFRVPGFEVASPGAFKRAGSIVGAKHDEGVFQSTLFFQLFHQSADALVQDIHHGGKDFHAIGFP